MISNDAVSELTARQLRIVLETVEGCYEASTIEEYKETALGRLQELFRCRNITFFAGRTYQSMFYDNAPTLIGDIAGLMDEWVHQWRPKDIFASDQARRCLTREGFVSIGDLGRLPAIERSYVEGYLSPNQLSDASAILLDFADGPAIIGMFGRDKSLNLSDELAGRILARHLRFSSHSRYAQPPNASVTSPLCLLTDRQREISHLVGQGMSNREIARELYLTEGSVKKHLSRIFDKLGLSNRAALTAALLTYRFRQGSNS